MILLLPLTSFSGSTFGADPAPAPNEFKVFQFPHDKIPRIDGDAGDWEMVPDEYSIGLDDIRDVANSRKPDPANYDLKVRLGWVKGLSRLYVLYEASDDYWNFDDPGLAQDVFEIVVDGDRSGGPLIAALRDDLSVDSWEGHSFHGVHAQNYHIFTPPIDKKWAFAWGCQPWAAEFPWANAATTHDLKHGEGGELVLEFWITPFDYAPFDGPTRAIVSKLEENGLIGFSFAVLDRDSPENPEPERFAFWTVSREITMYGNASHLQPFRLMPLDERHRKPVEAHWSFEVLDVTEGRVSFRDESLGEVTDWRWDFGDGTSSTERNPVHRFVERTRLPDGNTYPYSYQVTLTVEGPKGQDRLSKIWEVAVKPPPEGAGAGE